MRTRTVLILIAVFVLGAIAGVGGSSIWCPEWYHRDPHKQRQEFVRSMQKRLDLTPQQTAQFTALVDELMQRMHALHEQVDPQFEKIRDEQRNKIRAILNDDQRKKFDAWAADFDRRRKSHPPHP